jgi:LPXTG-site transpeptidase (sortase) family protein
LRGKTTISHLDGEGIVGIARRENPSTSYSLTMLAVLLAAIATLNLAKYKKFNLKNLSTKRLPLISRVLLIITLSVGLGLLFNIPKQAKDSITAPLSPRPVLAEEPTTLPPPADLDQRFQKFGLSIEKIGLRVPITENVDGTEKSAYEKPLLLGLAHYSGTALPGEGSNIFLFGHSTAGPVTNSYYGYTFAKIAELAPGDRVVLTKNGNKFTYAVTEKKIVDKTDVSVLDPTSHETLTLMTCWPAGKSDQRIIIRASLI